MKNLKFNFKSIVRNKARWLLTLIAILTLGVGQMWAGDNCHLGENLTNVYMRADWNDWETTEALTKVSGNEFYGVRYVTANKTTTKDYGFKLYISWNSGSSYEWTSSGAGKFTSSNTALKYWCSDLGNVTVEVMAASSGFVKLDYRLWAKYDIDNETTSRLYIGQTAVNNLSASLTADATSVQGGSTTTVRGGCTGGSGSYGYSYTATCGGNDVTATVLSGSGENRTFTAPMASTTKTYRVTITASEQNSQLTGLGFTGTNSKYVDITVPGITAPTVTLTVDKINVNQITLTGTINAYNGYGSNASDLSEVGFYIGETEYTATYKSGNTFKKTITGLTANTAYANVKAFATNPLATGNSSTTTVTTLADANYEVKVRVAHGANAPKVYAWTDADSYGGSKMENGTYGSQDASEDKFEATTYDWYTYVLNNKYENFLIYETGDVDKSGDFAATRTSDCYWYNKSGSPRAAKMVCPEFEPQLVLNDGSTETLYEMTGSETVSKSLSLAAGNYTIKVMYNTEYYGKSSSTIARTGSTSSNSISGLVVDGLYITLTADLAGTYTFSFNTTSKNLSVTFPEAYQVNFSAITVGGGTGSSAAPTATYNSGATSVTSGTTWIPTGTTVAFSAKSANAGYTFKGWYSGTPNSDNWSTNRIQEAAAYNRTVSASATIYAVYDEDDYTVTVNKTTGGSIASTSVTGHKTTLADLPTATADDGYYFTGWTTTAGTLTNSSSATTGKINGLTSTATVTANFAPIWRILGSQADNTSTGTDGFGGWDVDNDFAAITHIGTNASSKDTGYVELTLEANKEYQFKMFKHNASGDARYYGNNTSTQYMQYTTATKTWTFGNDNKNTANCGLRTAGAGTYKFAWNFTDNKLTITFPTSYTVTYDKRYKKLTDGVGVWNSGSTGGTIAATVGGNSLTSGKYVAASSSVVFTATPATGYSLYTVAGHKWSWYAKSDGNTDIYSGVGKFNADTTALTLTISKDTAAYVFFQENATNVRLLAEIDGEDRYTYLGGNIMYYNGSSWVSKSASTIDAGITTHPKIKAVPNEGYYFKEWQKKGSHITLRNGADNADVTGVEADSIICLKSDGTASLLGDTLIAVFAPLEEIYFENSSLMDGGAWGDVYVYFGISWESGKVRTNSNAKYKAAMTGTYHKKAYVPRVVTLAIGASTTYNIAFATQSVGTSALLTSGKAASRGDYNKKLNLFVPAHTKKATTGGVDYYDNGFWWQEDVKGKQGAGYYLQTTRGTDVGEFVGRADRSDYLEYTIRVDESNKGKTFHIVSAGGEYYEPYDYTKSQYRKMSVDTTRLTMKDGDTDGFTVQLTSEGNYTFILWKGSQYVWLELEYPASVGDYRLKHTYNSGAKATYSDIIKKKYAGHNTRYSMYLNKNSSPTLTLQECTSTAGGVPVFSDVATDNSAALGTSTGILKKVIDNDNGVYQFDMAIDTTTDAVTVIADSTRLYTGPFYIKTDAAPGKWGGYKSNKMDKNTVNFDRSDANTYDYYWCKYFASKDCNIKSVIANDYCNQLSDTVKGDGIARMVGTEPYVPKNETSIRFSYNSATNETKRAYLKSQDHDEYLDIEPNAAELVYNTTTPTPDDLYGKSTWYRRFTDNGNWVYEIDLKVYPGAEAGVSATYTYEKAGVNKDTTQVLMPKSNIVLGGTKDETMYSIRVVYDFKTNYMMSAFVLDGETTINEDLSDFDMLWVRHKEESATQLTLGTGKKLTNVRPIGAIEFKYDEMCVSSTSGAQVDLSTWSAASRPLLKYFISFPFDVEMNSIFGLNQPYYGLSYVIQKYNGAQRAKDGLFLGDGDNYWENMQPGDTLFANQGYCVILDNDYARWYGTYDMWHNKGAGSSVFMYFPAMEEIESITDASVGSSEVPAHECKINRPWGEGKNHENTDSHWNMIGSPLFHDAYICDTTKESSPYYLSSFYKLNYVTNKWDAIATKDEPVFKAMSSKFVQWYGTIGWTTDEDENIFKAPRRATAEDKYYFAKVEVMFNGAVSDRTYVELVDGADEDFILREDMCKYMNSGIPQIYTFAGNYDVAYNKVPIKSQTIPMGIVVRKNGTYTFSMPTNFSGTVTLIDNFAQTRTNLTLEDYEVTLEKGTINDRFELEIDLNKVPTSIENTDSKNVLNDGGVHKFIENDKMYILKNGVIYDATGRRVK